MSLVELLFWIGIGVLAYTYAGYPLLIRLASLLRPRPVGSADSPAELPLVTVLVIAYNEEARIVERVRNLLASDYPPERLQILIASDGSGDATAQRACANGSRRVEVVEFPERRGKSAVLNELIPRARGELVVLSDVRQRFEPAAIGVLVQAFRTPDTGAVSGELMLERRSAQSEIREGAGFYWRYEKFIRRSESRVDSTVGCTGAIYAIRRALFQPIPESTILDDVLIPMLIARQGCRVRFESRARAYDDVPATARGEFTRKVRTIAGNFQLFRLQPWLLNPLRNRLWIQTVSHKAVRLLSPLCLCAVLALNVLLVAAPVYRYLLVAQGAFYAAAALGYGTRHMNWRPFFLSVPGTFCLLNAATVIAFVSLLRGRQSVTWDKPAVRGSRLRFGRFRRKETARDRRSDMRA
ncbi:MAG: glycosyltransferase family 2 protein [Gammaproteobacteria bacterium]|nr:glycosyltransferase family 2 protein [Gammaproteobacteria bacterium]